MRLHRILGGASILLLLHLQVACTSYRPVPLGSLEPQSDVRVRFSSPTTVQVVRLEDHGVAYTEVPSVRSIDGRFISLAADTVRLEQVGNLVTPHQVTSRWYHSASFHASDREVVESRRPDYVRTGLLVGSVVGAVVLLIALSWDMSGGESMTWGAAGNAR